MEKEKINEVSAKEQATKTIKEITSNNKNMINRFLSEESKKIKNIPFPIDKIVPPNSPIYDITNAIVVASIIGITYNAVKKIDDLYDKIPKALLQLSKYNWFIDQNIDLRKLKKIVNQVIEGEIKDVDAFLTKYYREQANNIIEELKNKHSYRSNILSEIKTLINQKNYYSAVILILSQVDGISYDLTKKEKFFLKDKKLKAENIYRPEITTKISKDAHWSTKAFLSPIEESIPIGESEQYYKNKESTFNRHEIMHGVDISYGTEKNVLKSLSLLKYLSDLIIEVEEKNTKQ